MKNDNFTSVVSVLRRSNPPLKFRDRLAFLLFFVVSMSAGFFLFSQYKYVIFTLGVNHGLLFLSTSQPFPVPPSKSATPQPLPPPPSRPDRGLESFIEPPKVMHGMNDEELMQRASLSPKIREIKRHVPKVAFMFLVRGPVVLAPLWDKFFKGQQGLYSIYVHSSPSYNGSDPPDSVFHGRRIPSQDVEWGEISMVEAERRLLANALLDVSNQRFVLLSESCIPLFNFSTVYNYLIKSTQSFVDSYDEDGPDGRGRYNSEMQPLINIQDWRKGSQWFELDRDLAVEVVSDKKYFPAFRDLCETWCCGEEHYLATFMSMKFGEKIAKRSLTWADWSEGGSHPMSFELGEIRLEYLEWTRDGMVCEYNGKSSNVCFLFARKFTTHPAYWDDDDDDDASLNITNITPPILFSFLNVDNH